MCLVFWYALRDKIFRHERRSVTVQVLNAGKFFLLQLLRHLRGAFWTGRKIRKSLVQRCALWVWVASVKTWECSHTPLAATGWHVPSTFFLHTHTSIFCRNLNSSHSDLKCTSAYYSHFVKRAEFCSFFFLINLHSPLACALGAYLCGLKSERKCANCARVRVPTLRALSFLSVDARFWRASAWKSSRGPLCDASEKTEVSCYRRLS